MIETNINTNGLNIHLAHLQNGKPPLLMLHGVTRRWSTFLPVIHALSLRWNVHALDFRGHGRSDRADSYHVVDYTEDVVAFVQEHFSSDVVIYGHSLGAMVAAAAAAQLGDRVTAVIMEDPPMETMGKSISENILHSFFAGLGQFAGDPRSTALIAKDLAEVQLRNPQSDRPVRLGDIRDPVQLRFTAASLKHVDPGVFKPILAGKWLSGYHAEHIFRSITCPALLMQADTNVGGMLTDVQAAQLTDWSPDLTHIKMTGIGHVMHVAATSQLVNLVHSFLESLD